LYFNSCRGIEKNIKLFYLGLIELPQKTWL